MKPKFALRSFLLACGSSLLAANVAQAQLQWDANNIGAGQTDGVGTWLSANQWWNGTSNVTWNSATPDSANIGNGGVGGVITVGTLTAGTINLNNFTGTYTLQGTGTTLTQNGGITIGSTAGNVTIRGTGTLANVFTLSGAGGITMNGSGVLTLRENLVMNYTGATVINNGIVMLGGTKSAGNFSLNGGMLTDYYQATTVFTGGLGTGNNQIQIAGNSGFGGGNNTSTWRIGATGSTLVWGALGEGTATGFFNPTTLRLRTTADNNGASIYGNVTLDNRLDLNSGTRTFDVFRSGASITLSSARIDDGIQDTGGAGNLIKNGGGMLVIGGSTSTWGGTTTVNNGALDLSAGTTVANLGGGSGRDITLASGTGLRFGQAVTNAVLNRLAENSNEIYLTTPSTSATGSNANNLDFSSSTGANLPNAFLGGYASNNSPTVYSGTLTPAADNYRLGASYLGQGVFAMNNSAAMTGSQGLIVGGTIELIGAKTFTGDTVIRATYRLGLSAFTGSNAALSLQNSVLDTTASGGNIWLEGGASTPITGVTTSANGGTTSATFGGLSGNKNLSAIIVATSGGNNTSATAVTAITGFTLNTGSGVDVVYTGAIGGFGTGAVSLAGGNSTLTKTGLGTQELSGTTANTYTGLTTVTAGVLELNKTAGVNAIASNVGLGGNDKTTDILVNGGALNWLASNQVSDNASINVTSGSVNFGSANETIYDFNNSGGSVNYGTGYVTILDPTWSGGTNEIHGNTSFGVLNISGGTNTVFGAAGPGGGPGILTVGSTGGLNFSGTASPNLTVSSDAGIAGKVVLAGDVTSTVTSGTASISSGGAAANPGQLDLGAATRTFTVDDGSAAVDMTIGARINNGALIKAGAGTLELTGTNTYTGATSVNVGVLAVNGSLANTSTTVATTATLQGSGSIAGSVTVQGGGTLAAGNNNIQSLATGALTMVSGSNFAYDVADNSSTGADLLAVNGTLSLTGVNLTFDLATVAALSGGGWSDGNTLTLMSYSGADITSGFTGYTDDTAYAFGSNSWTFNYNDTVAGDNFGSDAIAAGQDKFVTMTFTAVPEPHAALLGAIGLLALLRRRR